MEPLFVGGGGESLFAGSGSHDQGGRRAHIWQKTLKIFSGASGPVGHDLFYSKVNFFNLGFTIGKKVKTVHASETIEAHPGVGVPVPLK